MSSKLRILVANHTLDMWGGSETYAYAVVEELVRRGHDVEIFTPHEGCVSKELRMRFGVMPRVAYDLLLVSHTSCVERLRDMPGFKIQTCHGTAHKVEQPAPGVDRYVAISEEVQAHLKKLGHDSTVIRNGVNCDRFCPKRPIRERPERVLAVVQTEEAEQFVAEACRIADLRLVVRNKFGGGVFRIEDDMVEADIVVSLGRGAYEAMACGRCVYVFDIRRYQEGLADGMIWLGNIGEMLRFNCSGRRFRRKVTPEAMAKEMLGGYSAVGGLRLRRFALEHLNIRTQVDKYLELRKGAKP